MAVGIFSPPFGSFRPRTRTTTTTHRSGPSSRKEGVLRAGDAVHVDRQRARVTARLRGSPAGVAGGIATSVGAIALGHRTLGGEATREGEVASRTRRSRGLLSRRPLGRDRDDRSSVDTRWADGTPRPLGASRTGRSLRAGSTRATARALRADTALADLALVTALRRFDLPHHAGRLRKAERASQRPGLVVRQAGGSNASDYEQRKHTRDERNQPSPVQGKTSCRYQRTDDAEATAR